MRAMHIHWQHRIGTEQSGTEEELLAVAEKWDQHPLSFLNMGPANAADLFNSRSGGCSAVAPYEPCCDILLTGSVAT